MVLSLTPSFVAALSVGPSALAQTIRSEPNRIVASAMLDHVVESSQALAGFREWSDFCRTENGKFENPTDRVMLVPHILERMPPEAWPFLTGILRERSGGVAAFTLPEILVPEGFPEAKDWIREAFSVFWPLLPEASLFEPDRSSSPSYLCRLPLLQAKRMSFSFVPPKEDAPDLSVRYIKGDCGSRTLFFSVCWSKSFPGGEKRNRLVFLSFLIRSLSHPDRLFTYRSDPKSLASPTGKNWCSHFEMLERLFSGQGLPSGSKDLGLIQRVLLEGGGIPMLSAGLKELESNAPLRHTATDFLRKERTVLRLSPTQSQSAEISFTTSDDPLRPNLAIDILWPKIHWNDLKPFDVWKSLARGLVLFLDPHAARGSNIGPSFAAVETSFADRVCAGSLPRSKATELQNLMEWLKFSPKRALDVSCPEFLPLRFFKFTIEKFVFKKTPGTPVFKFPNRQPDSGRLEVELHASESDFSGVPLMEWMERAWRTGSAWPSDPIIPASLFERYSTADADTWTWIRLLWSHHQGGRTPAGTEELLWSVPEGQKEALARGLAQSLRFESELWPKIKRRRCYLEWSRNSSAPKLTKIKIFTSPEARFVHMNGTPELSPEGWRQLLAVVQNAPEGSSELSVQQLPDRFKLVREVLKSLNYKANPAYSRASSEEQTDYRNALTTFSSLLRGAGHPSPTMSANELKAFYTTLVHQYHPDHRNTDGKDENGIFDQLRKAYEILKRFHP